MGKRLSRLAVAALLLAAAPARRRSGEPPARRAGRDARPRPARRRGRPSPRRRPASTSARTGSGCPASRFTTSRNMAPTSRPAAIRAFGFDAGPACWRSRRAGRPSGPACAWTTSCSASTARPPPRGAPARERIVRPDGADPRRARRGLRRRRGPSSPSQRGGERLIVPVAGRAGLRQPLPADPGRAAATPGPTAATSRSRRRSPPMSPTTPSWRRCSRTNSPTTSSRHRVRLDAARVSRGFLGNFGRNARLIRETEVEADRLSVYLLERAGYDPAGGGPLLVALRAERAQLPRQRRPIPIGAAGSQRSRRRSRRSAGRGRRGRCRCRTSSAAAAR